MLRITHSCTTPLVFKILQPASVVKPCLVAIQTPGSFLYSATEVQVELSERVTLALYCFADSHQHLPVRISLFFCKSQELL